MLLHPPSLILCANACIHVSLGISVGKLDQSNFASARPEFYVDNTYKMMLSTFWALVLKDFQLVWNRGSDRNENIMH